MIVWSYMLFICFPLNPVTDNTWSIHWFDHGEKLKYLFPANIFYANHGTGVSLKFTHGSPFKCKASFPIDEIMKKSEMYSANLILNFAQKYS